MELTSHTHPRTFDPMSYLRAEYDSIEPEFSYVATDADQHQAWETAFRKKLVELLGGFPTEKVPLAPEVTERAEFPGYVRYRIVFNSRPLMSVPAYLLLPEKIEGRIPGIVCLPGHGPGKDTIVGFNDDGTPRPDIGGYQADFAIQAARKGYAALAMEQLAFGERNSPDEKTSGCQVPTVNAFMLGMTMIGLRVWDARCALDYLQTLPEVDPDRIGVMGISGGGTATLYTAAVETRFKAAVASGYLCTFRDSIMAMSHCVDNFVPGMIKAGEMHDVASLIAPRAFFAESGTEDSIFPVKAAKHAYERSRQAWEVLGAGERIGHEVFEGEHQFWGRKAFEFLAHNL
jgi:hypothetical protein